MHLLTCYLASITILLVSTVASATDTSEASNLYKGCPVPDVANGRTVTLGLTPHSSGFAAKDAATNVTFVEAGTELFIFCSVNFALVAPNDAPVICQPNGRWSVAFGVCRPKKPTSNLPIPVPVAPPMPQVPVNTSSTPRYPECLVPFVRFAEVYPIQNNDDDPQNYLNAPRAYQIGDTAPPGQRIRVICFPGYKVSDVSRSEAVCLARDNRWTNPVGPCLKGQNYEFPLDQPEPGFNRAALPFDRSADSIQAPDQPGMPCGVEPEVPNGYIVPGSCAPGTRRVVMCRRGFRLQGSDTILCTQYGVWTSPGICVPPPQSPEELSARQQRPSLEGYGFPAGLPANRPNLQNFGSLNVEDRSPPELTNAPTCVVDPYVPNGKSSRGEYSVGSVRRIYCNPGFVLQGADSIVCSQFGHWSIPGSCVPVKQMGEGNLYHPRPLDPQSVAGAGGIQGVNGAECGPAPQVENGELLDEFNYFTTASARKKLRCKPGFDLVGPEEVFCNIARWSQPGTCVPQQPKPVVKNPNECTLARFVRNGRIAKESSGQLILKCDWGFSVMASRQIVCDPKIGRWRALGYCLRNEYVSKLEALRSQTASELLKTDDDRVHLGYSWERAPLLSDDSGCFNPKNQVGTDGSFWSLHYPCPYENRLVCVWDISAPEGDYIAIAFNDIFYIEPGTNGTSSGCEHDSLSFYVQTTTNQPSVNETTLSNNDTMTETALYFEQAGTFCGERRPKNMILTSHNVRVIFKTDNRYTGAGFRLVWASIRPSRLESLMGRGPKKMHT